MSDPWLGDYGWEHGPLVVGSAEARKALETDGAAALAGRRARISVATVADRPVWVLGGGAQPTRVWDFGPDCVVFVRIARYANPVTVLPTVLAYHPGWAPADAWKPVRGRLPLGDGELELFDVVAKHPDHPGPRADGPVHRFSLTADARHVAGADAAGRLPQGGARAGVGGPRRLRGDSRRTRTAAAGPGAAGRDRCESPRPPRSSCSCRRRAAPC